ncbi:hypothetical protein EDB81DRAFT_220634 [Dactylonectria macrodidyma]|uniref:Uncharacterized protein n=1 Tax=Dactylonectria macrodidyma TaxID=307937 RepID=A0A9P9IJG5_9HYPO|nr:hypothetical protein EDB81DRAFT_220634 [Dactylonectria macrodidyma]
MEGPPRPQTPSHHPIYGVHMSHERVRLLMAKAYPGLTVDSVSQLPSGNSYNNRINFIKIDHPRFQDFSGQAILGQQELVLELNGRFFGPDKIQNEVSCLRLMEMHCPNVPAPWVCAWSENGKDLVRISADRLECQNGEIPDPGMGEHTGGWILMSRIPGESLSSRVESHSAQST